MFYKGLFVILLGAGAAFANIDVENGQSETFKVSGYFDGGFTEWGAYNAVPSRGFSIRRSGVEFNARLVENLKTEIKIEARSDELFLKNALVLWSPVDWIRAQAGQFKTATLLAGELSYWNLNMFDRPLVYDLRDELTYSGRDLGVDMRIELPSVYGVEMKGTAGVFNGDRRGRERTDDELLYSLRGEMKIPFFSGDITLGASAVSHRLGISNPSTPSGYSVSARQNALSADASLNCRINNWYGISVAGEYSFGDNWSKVDVIAGDIAPRFRGYWGNVTVYFHPWNVRGIKTFSLSAGYDYVSPNADLDFDHSRLSVIGSVYPTDNLRLRFGGVKNTVSGIIASDSYTDFIAEVGIKF